MKFSVFQASRKGGRKKNEDRMGYCYTRDAALFMLADGMGGHPEGEVAAQLALQTFAARFQRETGDSALADPARFLTQTLLAAHERIFGYAQKKRMADTPRTTMVALLVQDSRAFWIHCGDSRLYLVRAGELLVRTRDHSYAEHASRTPRLPIHHNRNVLFTCIGSPSPPLFDLGKPVALQRGDRLLLCSDGLWGSLSDADITREIADHPVARSVPDLIDAALQRAGALSDNVTALALEWEASEDAPPTEPAPHAAGDEDDVFVSTLQIDDGEHEPPVDLDDATIERSIAEINAAIRRRS